MNPQQATAISLALPEGIESIVVQPQPPLTEQDYERFCAQNPELRVELNQEGKMIIMLPVTTRGGNRNFILTGRFFAWVEKDETGVGFDSSTGFTLPNGAKRSPDAAWIRRERWEALTEAQQNEFAPICPDFVIELRSKSDRLSALQEKLAEYIANGAQLGWLIDPLEQQVHIYRPAAPVTILAQPTELSGEPLLSGFRLNLKGILD